MTPCLFYLNYCCNRSVRKSSCYLSLKFMICIIQPMRERKGQGWLIKDVNVTRVTGYFPRGGY